MKTFNTFEEAYRQLAHELTWGYDAACSPRGSLVREVQASQFAVEVPRARVLKSPARAANYGFAAGEFCWYVRGASDVQSLEYYNKRTPQFSDDGVTLPGAYGPRLFGLGLQRRPSQWASAADELARDRDSRRAVLSIYNFSDALRAADGTKDVPCTLSIQYLLRARRPASGPTGETLRLDSIVTMRSCDLVWGLTYDVFTFTLLQEMMLLEVRERGVEAELGRYVHQAGSLHVYERHFDLARAVSVEDGEAPGALMPPLERLADVRALLVDEEALRLGADPAPPVYGGAAAYLRRELEEHARRRRAPPQTK